MSTPNGQPTLLLPPRPSQPAPSQPAPWRPGLWLAGLLGVAFGGLMLAGSWPLALLALVAVAAGVTVMVQPLRGLLLFCLVAPVIPWTTFSLGVRITVSEALLAVTWLGVLWQLLLGRVRWPRGPTERWMWWLMAWSVVPLVAGQLMVTAEGAGLVNWVRWLLNLSLLFLVPMLAGTRETRERLIVCLLLGYLGLVLLSVGLFAATRDALAMKPILTALRYAHPEALDDIFGADPARMASPWVHPNATGGALLLGVPLALFYGVAHTGWRRALGYTVALLGAAGIVFSGSRGALLCMGALVAWLAARRVPHAGRMLVIGAVLAAVMLTVYEPAQKRLLSLFSSGDVSTGVRFDEYANYPRAIARYPLGVGFKVDPPPDADLLGISNLWLNYAYKLGVPAALLFIGLTVAWWREVRRLGDLTHIDAVTAMRLGSVSSIVVALFTGPIDHYFSFTQVLLALFWLFMAISLQEARDVRAACPAPLPPAPAPR